MCCTRHVTLQTICHVKLKDTAWKSVEVCLKVLTLQKNLVYQSKQSHLYIAATASRLLLYATEFYFITITSRGITCTTIDALHFTQAKLCLF